MTNNDIIRIQLTAKELKAALEDIQHQLERDDLTPALIDYTHSVATSFTAAAIRSNTRRLAKGGVAFPYEASREMAIELCKSDANLSKCPRLLAIAESVTL